MLGLRHRSIICKSININLYRSNLNDMLSFCIVIFLESVQFYESKQQFKNYEFLLWVKDQKIIDFSQFNEVLIQTVQRYSFILNFRLKAAKNQNLKKTDVLKTQNVFGQLSCQKSLVPLFGMKSNSKTTNLIEEVETQQVNYEVVIFVIRIIKFTMSPLVKLSQKPCSKSDLAQLLEDDAVSFKILNLGAEYCGRSSNG